MKDFDSLIDPIIIKVKELFGATISKNDFDLILIKRLAKSNTLPPNNDGGQKHIALSGEERDLFPTWSNYEYLENNVENFKRFFLMKIPIQLNANNWDQLEGISKERNLNVFTTTALARPKTPQVELGEMTKDSKDWVDFRKLHKTDDVLIFLKNKERFEYIVFCIRGEDSHSLEFGCGFQPNNRTVVDLRSILITENNATNKIYFGCPGTGKSYKMDKETEGYKSFETTFHPEYDYATFVGSYKPKMKGDAITYSFTPQVFTNAYVNAYNNPAKNIVLKIEEINRGNCAMIFGDIFQLLDRHPNGESKYEVTPDADLAAYLRMKLKDKFTGKLKLPRNLSIYATMNTSDQSLFPMDSAFKRRWEWEYVPIDLEKADTMTFVANGKNYNWKTFLEKVNEKIYLLTQSEDKQLGTFFVSGESEIKETQFKTKVMFYLWFDVFKNEIDSEHNIFRSKENKPVTFSDLFKENNLLEEIMERLELIPITP